MYLNVQEGRMCCSSNTHAQSLLLTALHAQMQDVLVQTYSGKVVAFSEEEVGSYQPSSAPASPLKRLTTQFSKVHESLQKEKKRRMRQ